MEGSIDLDLPEGVLHRHLPQIVGAILGADPSTPAWMTSAAIAALQGIGPLTKSDGEVDYQVFPVAGELEEQARALIATRHRRIATQLDDLLSGLAKSETAQWWITPEQLAQMRTVIVDEHMALAVELYGPGVLPQATIDRLVQAGVLTEQNLEQARQLGLLGAAHPMGAEIDPDALAGITAEEARDAVDPLGRPPQASEGPDVGLIQPQTRNEYAARAARLRGGQQIVGLGNRVAQDLTTLTIDSDNERAQQLRHQVSEAVAQGLEAGDRTQGIRQRVAAALEDDYARDIDRIVVTELHAAMQQGRRDRIVDRHGVDALVAVIPSPGACRHCIDAYTEGGTPRLFRAVDLPPPSVNFRVRAADRVPCVPGLHPRCKCRLVRVPDGWHVNGAGQVLPPAAKSIDAHQHGEPLRKALQAGQATICTMVMIPASMAVDFPPMEGVGPHVTALFAIVDREHLDAFRAVTEAVVRAYTPMMVELSGELEQRGAVRAVSVLSPDVEQLRDELLNAYDALPHRYQLTHGGEWWSHASIDPDVPADQIPVGSDHATQVVIGTTMGPNVRAQPVRIELMWSARAGAAPASIRWMIPLGHGDD